MPLPDDAPPLPGALRDAVLTRLGFSRTPPLDVDGLAALYRAWCENVPFDNVLKFIALRDAAEAPLPGSEAEDFFAAWLEEGAGGTCWSSSNALFSLLEASGFAARRAAGSMGDLGVPTHGTVKVRLDGQDWLVDSSMHTNAPLPLAEETFLHDDPLAPVEIEAADESHLIWFWTPTGYLPCRLLLDLVDLPFYQERYEASRERSPFNQRLYARRNAPGEARLLRGNVRTVTTAAGTESRTLTPAEVCQSLREEIGLSEALIERWVRSGGLEATFAPPSDPPPPPLTGRPPSRRTAD